MQKHWSVFKVLVQRLEDFRLKVFLGKVARLGKEILGKKIW